MNFRAWRTRRTVARASTFRPLDDFPLRENGLELLRESVYGGDAARGLVPFYDFGMWTPEGRAGSVSLRVGDAPEIVRYLGHIGYGVEEAFRGQRLAARSCRLLGPLARAHGLRTLWITCDPENAASRRTCELVGARFIEIVPVPPDYFLFARGEPFKCRYRWDVE